MYDFGFLGFLDQIEKNDLLLQRKHLIVFCIIFKLIKTWKDFVHLLQN